MKRYNVDYKSTTKLVRLRNITQEELQKFLESLQTEEECALLVRQVKEKTIEDKEEER